MPIDEYVAHDLLAWYEVTPYKKPSDYVWATDANRAGAKRGKQPVWLSAVMRNYIQPEARKLGINNEDVVAHISPHVFYVAQRQRGGRQGCTGVVEALNGQDDPGHLHAGSQSAEACGAEQSGRHDQAKTKLYRRCTASFW
jgi:hypothetical protein